MAVEFTETGVSTFGLTQMQHFKHLFLRLASRSRASHSQATGNAIGREKQVAGTCLELGVEIEGESCVPFRRRCCLRDSSAKNVGKHNCGSDEMDDLPSHIRSRLTLCLAACA